MIVNELDLRDLRELPQVVAGIPERVLGLIKAAQDLQMAARADGQGPGAGSQQMADSFDRARVNFNISVRSVAANWSGDLADAFLALGVFITSVKRIDAVLSGLAELQEEHEAERALRGYVEEERNALLQGAKVFRAEAKAYDTSIKALGGQLYMVQEVMDVLTEKLAVYVIKDGLAPDPKAELGRALTLEEARQAVLLANSHW